MSDLKYMNKESITVFHQYEPEEAELSKQNMLETFELISKIEEDKKDTAASYTQQIKSLKSRLFFLNRDLKRNGEDRQIECSVYFDFINEKRVYKNSRGEIVLTLPFKESDYERPVPLIPADDEEFEDVKTYDDLPTDLRTIQVQSDGFGQISIKKKKAK